MEENDFWQSNLSILKKKDSKLYRVLNTFQDESDRIFYLDRTRDGDVVLSLEEEQKKIRLCSARNPRREAELFAKANRNESCEEYVVFGMALGYHVEALAKMTSKKIVVLESDLEVLAICMRYRNLKELLEDTKVTIVYCKNPKDYIPWLDGEKEDIRYCMWEPAIKTTPDRSLREILENYKVIFASMEKQGELLVENFNKNQTLQDECVDVLSDTFRDKTMILLAGGPSLEEHWEKLRELSGREDIVMLCVGKVAQKVLAEKIRPDYLVMTDAKAGTRCRIRGIENSGIPLIYLSTVAAIVANEYESKRYIAYQEGMPEAEETAHKMGYTLYESGGSVATFVIDLGIRMHCKRIIVVGLDMGYPGEQTHAGGVGKKLVDTQNLRLVEGVGGRQVRTGKTLDIYRRWIERRIESETEIEWINASNGARIHGMKERTLEEIF